MNRKNTILKSNSLSKNNVALFFFAIMLVGLLCSRSIASISMFLFAVNALRDIHPRRWFQQKWWLFGLVWVAFYAASWFWSDNKAEWGAHFQVKLPFLFLPLAFTFLDPWTPRQLRIFTLIFTSIMTVGAVYSLSFILRSPEAYILGYKYSHTIPTPAYNDHIAFSTIVAIGIAWSIYSWRFWNNRLHKIVLSIAITFLTIYLHILAAKSGLVALYLFLFCYTLYLLASNWKRAILLMVAGCIGMYTSYHLIPTLKERIDYTLYSYDLYKSGERTGAYSDVGRIISYDIACKIIAEKPLQGVGAGDVLEDMGNYYRKYYPQVSPTQYLFPHNQFLTTAVSVGIPATLAFIIWIFAPFRRLRRNRNGFFYLAIWLMLLVPLFVDPFLEVQSGVFVYLFFFLMQRSVISGVSASEKHALA